MTSRVAVPSLTGGISQQPDSLRLPSQAIDSENVFPSLVEGLLRRRPTEHLTRAWAGRQRGELVGHVVDRSASERYLFLMGHQRVRVWDLLTGDEVPVLDAVGGAGPWPYLDLRRDNIIPSAEAETLAWTLSVDAAVPVATADLDPYGVFVYQTIGTLGGATAPASYQILAGTFGNRRQWLEAFVKPSAATPADEIELAWYDDTNAVRHGARFVPSGGGFALDDADAGIVGGVQDEEGGQRLWIYADTAGLATTGVGDVRVAEARVQTVAPYPSKKVDCVGFRAYETASSATSPESRLEDPLSLRATTIQDATYVVNRRIITARGSATAPAAPTGEVAFLFVKQGDYDTQYRVDVDNGVTPHSVFTQTYLGDMSTAAYCEGASGNDMATCGTNGGTWQVATLMLKSISTDDIADDLKVKLDALSYITATRMGSVIKLTAASKLDTLEVSDGVGDATLVLIRDTVEAVADLPLICEDGFVIKVVGEADKGTDDDFYAVFVADEPGAFGVGHWEEAIQPGADLELDADTMPHVMVRKQDDDAGTLTGSPRAIYFEFGPATWDQREVGDDDTNPFPSFVGSGIEDLAFFKGRMALASSDGVILSEINPGLAGTNLFLRSVRQVNPSDVIDYPIRHDRVVGVRSAVPTTDGLLLASQFTRFSLDGAPSLTPESASAPAVLEYEGIPEVRPRPLGRTTFELFPIGDRTGLRELVPPSDTESGSYDEIDDTIHVPCLIEGRGRVLATSSLEKLVVVAADGAPGTLYAFKFVRSAQSVLQAAWTRMTFGDDTEVIAADFIQSRLWLAIRRGDDVFIESLLFSNRCLDPGSGFVVHLDRRVDESRLSVSYDASLVETTFGLPYDLQAGQTAVIATATGLRLTVVGQDTSTPGAHTVTVRGDYQNTALYAGVPYLSRHVLARPSVRVPADQGSVEILFARIGALRMRIAFHDTGYVRTLATTRYGSPVASQVSPSSMGAGGGVLGQINLADGVHTADVLSDVEDAMILTIDSNNTIAPFALTHAEWEIEFVPLTG